MKKIGSMIYPRHKTRKITKTACCECGKELTPDQAYYYVDSCNYAITENSKPYCIDCAKKRK